MVLQEYTCKRKMANGEIKEYTYKREIKGTGQKGIKHNKPITAKGKLRKVIPELTMEQAELVNEMIERLLADEE